MLTINVPTKILHTSPDLQPVKNEIREKQIKQAKKHLELAARKQRMVQILVAEDFYNEASVPLREFLESTLQAFAWLNSRGESCDYGDTPKNLSPHFIQETLVAEHGLPAKVITLLSELNPKQSEELTKKNPEHIKKLFAECQEIFSYVAADK